MNTSKIQSRLRVLALLAPLAAASPAWAGPVGALAQGSASGTFIVGCTTCPHADITMSGNPSQSEGGAGIPVAQVAYSGLGLTQTLTSDYVAGGASYAAQAFFAGAAAAPVVKARAAADNEQVWRPNSVGILELVGIDTYGVLAQAEAVQQYTFLGLSSETYTFNFRLDGTLSGSLASMSATAGFYAADDVFQEVALASGSAFAEGEFGRVKVVDESFSVTITLDPGQSYLLRARSSAGMLASYTSEDGFADAYNTFQVTSIQGNVSLLQALIPAQGGGGTAVPAPPSLALVALALMAAAGVRRRPVR